MKLDRSKSVIIEQRDTYSYIVWSFIISRNVMCKPDINVGEQDENNKINGSSQKNAFITTGGMALG